MKKFNVFIILFAFLNSLNFSTVSQAASKEDTIIAVVNDDVITSNDLSEYLRVKYLQLKSEGESDTFIEKKFHQLEADGLNRLIEDKLILQKAKESEIEVRDKFINEELDKIKKRYQREENFIEALTQNGLTITDLKNKIIDQYKIKAIIDQEIESKILINPQEVTNYYNQNPEKFKKPEKIDLESIFISKTADISLAKKKANTALNLIKEGKAFPEVAKQFSEAGSLGIIEKGKMLSIIEDSVFPLKEGEYSSVIEVENGFYIFKVKQKFPAQEASLQDVKNEIYNIIFEIKFKERYKSWISKLKEKAFIEIKDQT